MNYIELHVENPKEAVKALQKLLSNGNLSAKDIRYAEVNSRESVPFKLHAGKECIGIPNLQVGVGRCKEIKELMNMAGFSDVSEEGLRYIGYHKHVNMTFFK